MQIIRSGECKNSPRNAFVEDLAIDLFTATDVTGKVEAEIDLPSIPEGISQIEITHAISHGKIGAANGVVTAGGRDMAFAIFVEFTSTTAKRVRKIELYGLRPA